MATPSHLQRSIGSRAVRPGVAAGPVGRVHRPHTRPDDVPFPMIPRTGNDGRLDDDDLGKAITIAALRHFARTSVSTREALLRKVLGDADDARSALQACPRLLPDLSRW